MPVIIQSKKTASELETVRSDIVASEARSSDALDAHKTAYASKVAEIESSASALTDRLAAQETKQEADKVTAKAEHDAHVANFEAEQTLRDTQKADLEASIAVAKAEASSAVANLDSKLDTEKANLQANIDALAASSSGASGALTSRVDELESKVGADLTATINTALSDGVVQATLDGFLAKDTELAGALTTALNERTSADDAIKAKFDLLVAKLFEGLTFEGVTQADLSFGPTSGRITLPDGTFVNSVDDIDISQWQGRAGFAVADVVEVIRPGHNPDNEFDIIWITENDNDGYFETARYNPEGELRGNPYYWGSYTPGAVNTSTYYGDGNHTTGYNTITRRG